MNTIDFHILLSDLSHMYHAEYKRLQAEYQTRHRKGLIASDESEEQYILTHISEILEERKQSFLEKDAANRVSAILPLFSKERCSALQKKRYSTGYQRLDEALDGGFTEGVHYIGAISSLGKSTFALQMADQMASRRINVVYISLEMGREDLVAKLVSLHLFTDVGGDRFSKTATELTSVQADAFTNEEWDAVHDAVNALASHSEYITIKDARARGMSVDEISEYVRNYTQAYGVAPVVIIDYLQIMTPAEGMERCTDKQVVDYNVAEFRALTADYNIPVIVISSFNRDSYDSEVTLKSYKDSGNIEYSSDTLIGLQLQGVGTPGFDSNEAKAASVRRVELVVLKQRYGRSGYKIGFDFYTRHNYFEEQEATAAKKVYRIH